MIWKREPVMFMAVLQAVLVLVVSFGLDLSTTQTGAIAAVAAAVLGLIARTQVSPDG